MNTYRLFLNKPFPFMGELKGNLINNVFIGLFVTLFLTLFQPFEINEWQTDFKVLKLVGFGCISFLAPTLVNLALARGLKNHPFTENWTVVKEIGTILCVLLLIAFGNLLFGHWLGIMYLSLSTYLGIFGVTCAIGIFPVSLHVVLKHNRLLKQNLEQSQTLNNNLGNPNQSNNHDALQSTEQIVLVAENEKDSFTIESNRLLYIVSADNYSEIVFVQNNTVQRHLIRSSLKRLEGQLKKHLKIVRCHRAYIVNLSNVKKVEGNAAGYRLYFELESPQVPVSRAYIATVNKLLNP